MKAVQVPLALFGSLVLSTAAFAGGHTSGPTAQIVEGGGSCNYTMQNMFAGPYKVCQTNLDAANCEIAGQEAENSDASHVEGDCSAEGAIGACAMEGTKVVYYEGDPSGLEIGCGFQSGTWESME